MKKHKKIYQLLMIVFCVLFLFTPQGKNVEANTKSVQQMTIYSGNTQKLKLPGDYDVNRYVSVSSNEKVAEVDHGVVIAKASGKATITTIDQLTNTTYVTRVTSKAGTLSLKSTGTKIITSQSTTIYPVLNKGVFTGITYQSSDASIASVKLSGNHGIVTGHRSGTAKITVTVDVFGTKRTASIDVTVSKRKIPVSNPQNASQYNKEDKWSGDYVYFGNYEQDNNLNNGMEPILWRVLEVTDDSVLLLSEYGLESRNVMDTFQAYTWETSSIRKFLNNDFLDTAFTRKEANAIRKGKVATADNKVYGTSGGKTTKDKVFLLSVEEATNPAYGFYPNFLVPSQTRTLKVTQYALKHDGYRNAANGNTCWWLRSMGLNNYYASYVYTNGCGTHHSFVGRRHDAIRPAIRVKLSAVSFKKQKSDKYYTLKAN